MFKWLIVILILLPGCKYWEEAPIFTEKVKQSYFIIDKRFRFLFKELKENWKKNDKALRKR